MKKSDEYMKENKIKSMQTLYNWQKAGKIKLVKQGNKNFVIDLENKDNEVENLENDVLLNDLELKNSVLVDKIKELEEKIYKLEIDLKGKEYEINGLNKQIENLLREVSDKQTLIIGLQQQLSEINRTNILLLEHKKKKFWFF